MLEAKSGDDPLTEVFLEHAEHLWWNFFAKIVNGWKPWTVFVKISFIDFWQGLKYAFDQGYLGWGVHAQSNYDSINLLSVQSVSTVQN